MPTPAAGNSTCTVSSQSDQTPCSRVQRRAGEDSTTEDGSITNLASGLGVTPPDLTSRPKIAPDEDREMVETSRGTSLLLSARERVLSLSEQRARFNDYRGMR